MIGPSRRGCGQNAGEVATATVRGTACCSEPSPHAAAVADSLVTEDGHGSVRSLADPMTHLVSTACVPRRGVARATDRHRRHWGAARGPPVNQQTSPSGAKVVPRARAALARTQETDHLRRRTTRLRSKVGAWRPHSGLLPRWQPRGRPGPGCGKAAVGTDRRRSGTLAVAAALGLVRDPRNGSAPPRGPQGPKVRTSVRHAKPFPGQRQAGQQNPQKHHSVEGGGGGYPGVKVRVSGHLPDRSQSPHNLTGTPPRVSRFTDRLPELPSSSLFPSQHYRKHQKGEKQNFARPKREKHI